MKRMLKATIGAITFATAIGVAYAQSGGTGSDRTLDPKSAVDANRLNAEDRLVMQGGKMMVRRSGKMSAMDQDWTFSSGTKVMRDGRVMTKDGKTMTLKDGQMISPTGELTDR